MSKLKRVIGYEKFDNVITGILLGVFGIVAAYYGQMAYYNVEALGIYGNSIQTSILKLSLLGALFIFLVLNYFEKMFAMKGVLLTVIIVAAYLVYKIYFSS